MHFNKPLYKNPSLGLLLLFTMSSVLHESFAQTPVSTGNVVERAMEDELKRSMEELTYEDYEKPFFISYKIEDTKRTSITASLGALIQSNHFPVRNKAIRVMVGEYDFNDESLDIQSTGGQNQYDDIPLPVEDDYYGIRRGLWITTDNIYKSATKLFRESQQYVKQQSLPLEKLPHRRFAKAPVVQLTIPSNVSPLNMPALEALVRDLSGLFSNEADIQNSMVNFNAWTNTTYIINSEGSRIQFPTSGATIHIVAEMKTAEGESIFEQALHVALTPDQLPDKAALTAAVGSLIERLKIQKNARVFEDSYTGPVLFMGESVGAVFASGLFGSEPLVASNDISTRNGYASGYGRSSLDDKLGKKVLASELTVKSVPTLSSYKGIGLLGSYPVDGEGVVPAEELTLVKEGTLVALLNSRTTTEEQHTPNGHCSDYQQVSPAVIQVSASSTNSMAELKSKLISLAKEEGLSYAIIIKSIPFGNFMGVNVYKVSLTDGKEELLRLGRISQISMKTLKNIKGASSNSFAYNTASRSLTSYIVPEGLLLNDIEVLGNKRPYLGNKELVENPLKAGK